MNEFLIEFKKILIPWFFNHGIPILFIAIGAFIINKILKHVVRKLVTVAVVGDKFLSKEAEIKREETLIRIFNWINRIVIVLLASLMILQEGGIPIGPILAGAGIIGLAVGFGAQYFIKDIISGFFIILENQYRIGDVVNFDGTKGEVEDISMRMTSLRDMDGIVHHVPHGEIRIVSNLTKHFARINLELGIAYHSDIDQVISVVNNVGIEMNEDPYWKEIILNAPHFLRVNDFADSAIVIKIIGEAKAMKQWEVTGELRKRLKIAFDREGIEIPFPQRVIHKAKENLL